MVGFIKIFILWVRDIWRNRVIGKWREKENNR